VATVPRGYRNCRHRAFGVGSYACWGKLTTVRRRKRPKPTLDPAARRTLRRQQRLRRVRKQLDVARTQLGALDLRRQELIALANATVRLTNRIKRLERSERALARRVEPTVRRAMDV
jgi:hypothetical protein